MAATVHYSGIAVRVATEHFEACAGVLASMPGVQIHYRYPATGHLVIVQETGTLEAQQDGLLRIQHVPGVVDAELVYHYVDHHPDAPIDAGRCADLAS